LIEHAVFKAVGIKLYTTYNIHIQALSDFYGAFSPNARPVYLFT